VPQSSLDSGAGRGRILIAHRAALPGRASDNDCRGRQNYDAILHRPHGPFRNRAHRQPPETISSRNMQVQITVKKCQYIVATFAAVASVTR
jgi:hypothetical protein